MASEHIWIVSKALVETLEEYDCSLGDAKAALADAAREFERKVEAAYDRQQESLAESGGRDDSAYRRDMIAAGRGHLLR